MYEDYPNMVIFVPVVSRVWTEDEFTNNYLLTSVINPVEKKYGAECSNVFFRSMKLLFCSGIFLLRFSPYSSYGGLLLISLFSQDAGNLDNQKSQVMKGICKESSNEYL